ncbi:MAG: glycosyltransferase family 2 protein [Candidatus Korobacteraceae bacterium]|jgi:glycosyltransferase involved in cell wall biosynthesis
MRSTDIALDMEKFVNSETPEISVVMPCLNEAETLATCIGRAVQALRENGIDGEIVVADNGSTDGSQEIATRAGARVVKVSSKGYGNALRGGIDAAGGRYVIMGDADASYDFGQLPKFLEKLREGNQVVMGNRFSGGILPGAMPPLHRYLGNPVLTGIGRLFFDSPSGDFHCGLRAFSKKAYEQMELRSIGMEFASEMVVRATLLKMKIAEVPTTLAPDGRSREPHLRTWRDGWRHLRFLLLYSPRWLFLYPGIAVMAIGLFTAAWLLPQSREVGHVIFDVRTFMFAIMLLMVGFQAVAFAVFAKIFGITQGLLPPDPRLDRIFRYVKLETGLLVGGLLVFAGTAGWTFALCHWRAQHFGPMSPALNERIMVSAIAAFTLGLEVSLSSFFLSLLGLARRES